MNNARLETFNNTPVTPINGLSLSIADWQESRGVNRQAYRPVETRGEATRSRESAVGEATRNGVAPTTPADASATISRNVGHISYSSASGFLHIPKEIEGVDQPTAAGVEAMPKTQEIPKEPGLTTPEAVPPLPTDPITEACENSTPGTGPWSNPEVPICPGPGIRSNPATGRPLSDTIGQ